MIPKPTLTRGRIPALSLLLTLGVALAGALLAPTAAAACTVTADDAGVVLVVGGSGCTYGGHAADFASLSVADHPVISYQGNGWQPSQIDVLGQPILP